jgi:hypothetical protein
MRQPLPATIRYVAALCAFALLGAVWAGQAAAQETGEGAIRPQIIGGYVVDDVNGPLSAVRLIITAPTGKAFSCSGTVISPRHVLTAAHCIATGAWSVAATPSRVEVEVPLHSNGGVITFQSQTATAVFVHPGWGNSVEADGTLSDVAIVTVGARLATAPQALAGPGFVHPTFTEHGVAGADEETIAAVVSGYGVTAPGAQRSELLRAADLWLSVAGPSNCAPAIVMGMLCSSPDRGNACFGDSGGPVRIRDTNGELRLMGVVSAGNATCTGYEFHVNVSQQLDWITSITGPLPATRPAPATNINAQGSAQRLDVSWTLPSDGGSPIARVIVTVEPAGVTQELAGAETSVAITGLANDVAQTVTVTPENVRGSAQSRRASGTPTLSRSGYWLVDAGGDVYSFGDAETFNRGQITVGVATVDAAAHPLGRGLWVLQSDGVIQAFGRADPAGAVPAGALVNDSVTSIAATPDGSGYWVFTAKGAVYPFGTAQHFGDVTHLNLNGAVIDSVATSSGNGYWMVASDGGVFTFGDAAFVGSTGALTLNQAVVGIIADPDGVGYWLIAADGGVFSFSSDFRGSVPLMLAPGVQLNAAVVAGTRHGDGYLLVGGDGGVFNFSDREFLGSLGAEPPVRTVVTLAAFVA